MDESQMLTVITSIIAALGGTQAWEYYKRKAELKANSEMAKIEKKEMYRDELKQEVDSLRERLDKANSDKEQQMKSFLERINELSQELAAMKVRVEFLEKENANLRKSAGIQEDTD
jgi:predicted RNase H-like nuclease (RuvC/YqgF family)